MFLKFNKFTIIWMVVILILTLVSGVRNANISFRSTDILVHSVMFCVLSFVMIVGLAKQGDFIYIKYHAEKVSLYACTVFGILVEILQFTTATRSFHWNDVLANLFGTIIGWGLFNLIYKTNLK
jgi:hypothetical protein